MDQTLTTLVFDFADSRRRAFEMPRQIFSATRLADVRTVIEQAESAARAGFYVGGFVSYEAAPAFDPLLQVVSGARMPLAWFAAFDQPGDLRAAPQPYEPVCFEATQTNVQFSQRVERIRDEIAAGHTYQVNLTTRFTAEFAGDAFALYEALRRAQGRGYHAFIDTGDFVIASASPELFFQLSGGRIRTRPMKGTRARGRWLQEDTAQVAALATSEKDRAENLMIVDLLRNDLGRVATTGSVTVTSLFDIERYRTVHQMTSTIEAELSDAVTLFDVFTALFPCGSVTGAPKISTMRLIARLEDSPREVYCGAVGLIEPGGNATFNVPIRTVWIERVAARAVYGSGAGITFDSNAADEFAEVTTKTAVLLEPWPEFELLETMRAEKTQIVRVDRHTARLLSSARYFDFPVDESSVRSVLERAAADLYGSGVIRLLVDRHGVARTEVKDLDRPTSPSVALAGRPVFSASRFLFHKTTHRQVYETLLNELPACWDVLLWNERGELTEFTRGNVVVQRDGQLLTPPQQCGLLAGTFRAELLEAGRIREAVLLVDELALFDRVWLINSVREWVEVNGLQSPAISGGISAGSRFE